MCAAIELTAADVRRSCLPSDVPFATTADAPPLDGAGGVVGQDRAAEALRFGIGVRRDGYNLFAIGPAGVGKQTLLRQLLGEHAAKEPTPSDFCYVHDFSAPDRPRALELPAGRGVKLQRDLDRAVGDLRVTMRSVFESEEYRTRKKRILDHLKEKQVRALTEIQERAKQRDVAVVETPSGIVLAPIDGGEVLDPERFQALAPERQETLQATLADVGGSLQELLREFHAWAREHQASIKELDREMAASAARHVLDAVRRDYADLPGVMEHLAAVELDVVSNAGEFLEAEPEGMEAALRRALRREEEDGGSFKRYRINVIVDRSEAQGAPVVYEDNPSYANLIGRIEHETRFGAMTTNFLLVRGGALHRAIGGYLVLDALRVLQHPMSWEALKRALRSGEIEIESLGQAAGLLSPVSIEPAPIPLGKTKIVLSGERSLYYLMASLDPDFHELFKVLVDFEESMDRDVRSQQLYARLVASLVGKEGLRPFDRGAVARVIDHAARATGDAEKLSLQMRATADLLREADYFAGVAAREVTTSEDVERAIEGQIDRASRLRERLREAVRRGDVLVSTSGERVGQVNGLSVYQLGEHLFGHPTRITAEVRLGKGEVVDIEREVALGGPIHTKGVLILGGYLGARFGAKHPLSFSATLVFEQSYGGVEGDSASLAELCVLMSALSGVPIKQSLAITGSVNQHGEAQSIGGVNEKIEGFFDVCAERGLTGEQGVLVPKSNVKNLMLRRDVADAIGAGRFHVHAIEDVDDAIALLTGRPSGARDASGAFPEGSVSALVEAKLTTFAERARAHFAKL